MQTNEKKQKFYHLVILNDKNLFNITPEYHINTV
jgi:hypothetical protein